MGAVEGGPNVVNSGLVLCLDAANNKSFVSGSTVWTDLSPYQNNGTLMRVSGPTFNSGNGGSVVFDGSQLYVQTNFTMPTTHTVNILFKRTKTTYWQTLYGCEIWNNNTGYLTYFAAATTVVIKGNTSYTAYLSLDTSIYNLYSITRSSLGSSSFYANGQFQASGSLTNTTIPNTLKIGSRHLNDGTSFTDQIGGNVAYFSIYNRDLSATEILQNYNTIKGRFNL